MDTAGIDIVLFCLSHDIVEYSQSVSCTLWDTLIIRKKSYNFPLRISDQREQDVNLVTLSGYGVDQTRFLADAGFVSLGQNIRARAVYSDRKIRYFLNAVDHPFESFNLHILLNGCTAVDIGSACFVLSDGSLLDKLCIFFSNGLSHNRNRSIDLFTNNNHRNCLLNIICL